MAITTITNSMVSVNAIQGTLIADNAITAVHIASNAVASIQIAENNVTAREIAANTITVAQLADDCVESDKIADGVITTNHLNKAMISSQTEVAVATGDFILLGDTSDSNNLKKAPISSILAGTLTTAAQTNITSVGTLTSFRSTGIDDNADATAITIDTNGNVLVGHTDVRTAPTFTNVLQVEGTGAASASMGIIRNSDSINPPYFIFGKSRGTSTGSNTIVQSGDSLGAIRWTAADGVDMNGIAAEIKVYSGATPASNDTPGILAFSTTAEGSATSTERMRIDSSGKVGIGETTPLGKLHVKSGDSAASSVNANANELVIENADYTGISILGENECNIHFGDNEDPDVGRIEYHHSSNSMIFRTNASDRMLIDSSGNVGIGHTTTTGSKLAICDGANSQIQFFPEISTDTNLTQHYDPTASAYINAETRAASHVWKIGTSEYMRVHTDGKVGINIPSSQGVTSPAIDFEAWDQDGVTKMGIGNNAAYIQRYQTHASGPASLVIDKARGTQASPSIVSPGDDLGRIIFRGYTNNLYEAASIQCEVNTSNLVNNGADIPSDLYFKTTQDGGGGPVERMRILYDGNVGIGIAAPTAMLHLFSSTTEKAKLRLDVGGGSDVWDLYASTAGRIYVKNPNYSGGVYIQHTHTSWSSNSDENLKENITSLETVGDKLKNYRTSYFTWKDDNRETPKRQIGFIAQDWEDDFPEVIDKADGEPLGMRYTETIPILLKYIQELEARIETLEG